MDHSREQDSKKKPYRPPTLIEYGSVAKLTEKKSGTKPDGKSGRFR
ncbi:lasso RiPP family leader peptide-containing protein [Nitrospira sp. Kam-Ns4a]